MYGGGYGSPPPTINNPFAANSAQSRFPDINGGASPVNGQEQQQQYASWMGGGLQQPQQTGYYPQQNQSYPQNQQMYPQNQSPYPQNQQSYAPPQQSLQPQYTAQPFQPSSSFGQQLSSQVTGSSYGYLYGQQQQQQQPSPQQQNYSNVAQFDPYSSIGQGLWDAPQTPQQQQQPQQPQPQGPIATTTPGTFNGSEHPREYVRTHKSELERWDTYSWKQLLNAFDALKAAWESRRAEMDAKVNELSMQMQYNGGGIYAGQIQQEGSRVQGLRKEAEDYRDSVSASSFQLDEVLKSYRQSGDPASKRLVREASNAALRSLPDWPPLLV